MTAWIDCTNPIDVHMPSPPGFPGFSLESVRCSPFSLQHLGMATHHGTHIDAPRHFFVDGSTIDEIPVETLAGTCVVVHIPVASPGEIPLDQLREVIPRDVAGKMLFVKTGWSSRYGADDYVLGPYLTEGSAEYLVGAGIVVLGVDFLSPDEPRHDGRAPDFDYPVHRRILGAGIPIVENLSLDHVRPGRYEIVIAPMPLVGGDGSPARVLVRPVRTERSSRKERI